MKKIISVITILATLATLLALASCTESYIDTVSSAELADIGIKALSTSGNTRVEDEDFLLEFTDEELDYLVDFTVISAVEAKNINEIGIFHVESGSANDMKKLVSKYVENKQASYRAMDYFPEEVEKIDFATVKVFGNYVVYSFLGELDTESFYSAVENAIKK